MIVIRSRFRIQAQSPEVCNSTTSLVRSIYTPAMGLPPAANSALVKVARRGNMKTTSSELSESKVASSPALCGPIYLGNSAANHLLVVHPKFADRCSGIRENSVMRPGRNLTSLLTGTTSR